MLNCPSCNSTDVHTSIVNEEFIYGTVGTKLKAIIPVNSCSNCDLEYTTEAASRRRTESISKYLNSLCPANKDEC